MHTIKFKEIDTLVERDWGSGGLSTGLYYDYPEQTARRYLEVYQQASGLAQCPNCRLGGAWKVDNVCMGCGYIQEKGASV